MTTSQNTPRRWFQFRLRTLLLVTLAFSVVLAATTHRWRVWQSQHQAYQKVTSSFGFFVFSCEERQPANSVFASTTSTPPASAWRRFCFGEFTGTTRVELTLPIFSLISREVVRDENGEYVYEREVTRGLSPWDDTELMRSVLALDRLDRVVLSDMNGSEPDDVKRAQIAREKAQVILRRFPNCEVTYLP